MRPATRPVWIKVPEATLARIRERVANYPWHETANAERGGVSPFGADRIKDGGSGAATHQHHKQAFHNLQAACCLTLCRPGAR